MDVWWRGGRLDLEYLAVIQDISKTRQAYSTVPTDSVASDWASEQANERADKRVAYY